MGRRRFCWIQGGAVQYEFAIIYYKDAGDSKTVWLRDGDAAPVQIATWPKRVSLFSPQTASDAIDLTQGYVGYLGGESTSIDDARATTVDQINPYRNTVDTQVSLVVQGANLTYNFAGKIYGVAGIGGGGPFNFSGFQSLPSTSSTPGAAVFSPGAGDTWTVNFASISNNYGVIGLIKTPSKTLFSLVDEPAVSSSPLPTNTRRGRVTYGQAGGVLSESFPTAPTYDPDFNGPLIATPSTTYQGGLPVWRLNSGTAVDQPTEVDADLSTLIGVESAPVSVFNFTTNTLTNNILVPGIEAGAEKIIAIVALAV
jgi:hypothetical protein